MTDYALLIKNAINAVNFPMLERNTLGSRSPSPTEQFQYPPELLYQIDKDDYRSLKFIII